MTGLFLRFYGSVLIVLFLAWWIHGSVLKQRAQADTERVITAAHAGGARLVAQKLGEASVADRAHVLAQLQKQFRYPLALLPLDELPSTLRHQLTRHHAAVYWQIDKAHHVVAVLPSLTGVVRLGPFPEYRLREIEESIGGWMRLAASTLDATPLDQRPAVLDRLRQDFVVPVDVADLDDLPVWPRSRVIGGEEIVFYPLGEDQWYAATPLSDRSTLMRFGPFPSFERIEQKAAATTLALVLLPAALAIALLLRPVARQLRHVEHAAHTFAAGDLSARVDERRVRSAKPLAQSFNNMAARTEALLRTQRELLQAVSHELRTPLTRLRFAVDLIETAQDGDERKRRLESLDVAVEELDGLVGELLTYVRMETTQTRLFTEQIAVRELLDELIRTHAALTPSITFTVDDSVSDERVITAERAGLQRTLGNLLSNAGRFAKKHVVVRALSVNGATVVDIDDDGGGIPQSERTRVFEPFVRLRDDLPDRGVGLGLALVKRIVTRHGGSVEALTSPLGGCRIRTTWPDADQPLTGRDLEPLKGNQATDANRVTWTQHQA
jgi:two-component system, OmpR family, sensor histidine kinase RstB